MPIRTVVTAEVSGGTTALSNPVPLNLYNEPFDVGILLQVECSAGDTSVTAKVQHTFDDLDTVASATWIDHASISAQGNVNVDGSYTEPVYAVRANIAAGTAAGPQTKALLHVIQTGY